MRTRAFTLIEATIAVFLVGLTFVAALHTLGSSVKGRQVLGERARGRLLAEDLLNEILPLAYEDPDYAPGSFGLGADEVGDGSRALWEDVDDYNGWKASPPQEKDGSEIPDLAGWERSVWVAWVDGSDLATGVGSDTRIKCIVVTVRRNGRKVGEAVGLRTAAWDDANL